MAKTNKHKEQQTDKNEKNSKVNSDHSDIHPQKKKGKEAADDLQPQAGIEHEDDLPDSESLKSEDSALLVLKLEEEIKELNNKLLLKQADFENFRKRMFRERDEAVKYGNSKLLLDIISLVDNFELAIDAGHKSRDFDSFYQGVEITEKQFVDILERNWGLKKFSAMGMAFDPERHEAFQMEESAGHTEQTVIAEFQKGYTLHERVIRPAKVKVAIPKQEDAADEPTVADESDA